MSKLLPSLLALLTAGLAIFSTQLQGVIASHPAASGILAAVAVVVSHLLPSPIPPAAK